MSEFSGTPLIWTFGTKASVLIKQVSLIQSTSREVPLYIPLDTHITVTLTPHTHSRSSHTFFFTSTYVMFAKGDILKTHVHVLQFTSIMYIT